MSTVGTTSHDGSVVDLNVRDLEIVDVKTLGLTVSLQVVDKNEEELASSFGPSALVTGSLDEVTLSVTTNTTVVAGEGDGLLVGNNVVEILLSLDQRHMSDGTTDFASILEVDSEVGTASLTTYTIIAKQNQKRTLLSISRSNTTIMLVKVTI